MSILNGLLALGPIADLHNLSSLPIFAYLDPGTGSFMLQLLIASLLSGLYAARHWWYQIKCLVLQVPRNDD
ncbi:MAG TPA: hypothetical protein VGZ22_30765 [Isosphaeraceae bacterium]|nr:hypothetical protein [Isosphaeraceae bacterium]